MGCAQPIPSHPSRGHFAGRCVPDMPSDAPRLNACWGRGGAHAAVAVRLGYRSLCECEVVIVRVAGEVGDGAAFAHLEPCLDCVNREE